jgi:Tfp pilus assembly protein PilF
MGMSEDAEAAYRQALALNPKSGAANYNLGAWLARQGRMDEAIVRFKAAIEADPKNTAAQQALAQALVGGGAGR